MDEPTLLSGGGEHTHGSSCDESLFNGSSVSANARAISDSRPRERSSSVGVKQQW